MAISKENKEFITNLIDYYISTASSYKDLAIVYKEFTDSVEDTALGMIAGSVYSSFMQIYQNQQITPSLEDMKEFNEIMQERSPDIKKAILESNSEELSNGTSEKDSESKQDE